MYFNPDGILPPGKSLYRIAASKMMPGNAVYETHICDGIIENTNVVSLRDFGRCWWPLLDSEGICLSDLTPGRQWLGIIHEDGVSLTLLPPTPADYVDPMSAFDS